jgi:hypothetical protein
MHLPNVFDLHSPCCCWQCKLPRHPPTPTHTLSCCIRHHTPLVLHVPTTLQPPSHCNWIMQNVHQDLAANLASSSQLKYICHTSCVAWVAPVNTAVGRTWPYIHICTHCAASLTTMQFFDSTFRYATTLSRIHCNACNWHPLYTCAASFTTTA